MFSSIKVKFDLILCNPPYVPGEIVDSKNDIDLAWNGGNQGRVFIDRLISLIQVKYFNIVE